MWALSRLGFSGMFSSSFSFNRTSGKTHQRITNAQERFTIELKQLLQQCTIDQDDALTVLARFDTERAFHFIDPPYVGRNMGHYAGMFGEDDLHRLLEQLCRLKGKFMLTMYPNESIQQFVDRQGWQIHVVQRAVTASNTKRRQQEEWMVVNYRIGETEKNL